MTAASLYWQIRGYLAGAMLIGWVIVLTAFIILTAKGYHHNQELGEGEEDTR